MKLQLKESNFYFDFNIDKTNVQVKDNKKLKLIIENMWNESEEKQ